MFDLFSVLSKTKLQSFCIENEFELVELDPFEDGSFNSSEDEVVKELDSYERIYQSTQAYVWPNLSYKEIRSQRKGSSSNKIVHTCGNGHPSITNSQSTKSNVSKSPDVCLENPFHRSSTSELQIQPISIEAMNEAESFEKMFSHFVQIKGLFNFHC